MTSPICELFSNDQMYQADAWTAEHHTPGIELMENAGGAVSREILARFPKGQAAVICGPGNNGGDGFVVARHLMDAGWQVRLGLLGSKDKLKGDAAEMADRFSGDIGDLSPDLLSGADVIVDTLFGAGLNRPIEDELADLVGAINDSPAAIVSVDVPSGIEGDTGQIRGTAVQADLTVTFFRRKPGHLLMPGRRHCGEQVLADIGIPENVFAKVTPDTFVNTPVLWGEAYPSIDDFGHKYDKGHALVVSGGASSTGAARLAARGALRAGAGLVTIVCTPDALAAHAARLDAIMTHDFENFEDVLQDERRNAVCIGPGNGVGRATRSRVLLTLEAGRACVLDADAITSFQDRAEKLFKAIGETPCVITPHAGEFGRLFGHLREQLEEELERSPSKLELARAAAKASGAVLVFKGADTVIAAPDGRAAINENAPVYLATAGSGDVLSGMITGLLAQNMAAFEAACCGVWMHGEAANIFGPGLIAEDLPETLPKVLGRIMPQLGQTGA